MRFKIPGFLFILIGLFIGCSGEKETTKSVTIEEDNKVIEIAKLRVIDGSLYDTKGEYASAILEYQEALKFDKSPGIYYLLAKDYANIGKVTPAVENARICINLEPQNITYRELLAEIFFNAFELDSAISQYEKILKIDSTSEQAIYNLALLYKKTKPLTSIRLFKKLIDENGTRFDILLHLIDIYSNLDKSSEELSAVEELVKIDPGNTKLKQLLAEYYLRSNKPEKALIVYEELYETNPDDEISGKLLADFYSRKNEYDKAEKIFDNFLKNNPKNVEMQAAKAFLYARKKEWVKAKALFIPLLNNDTLKLEFKLDVASIYYITGDSDKTALENAKEYFEIISKKYPDDPHAYYYLCAIAVKNNDLKSVASNFDHFLDALKTGKINGNFPFYATEVGRLFLAKEDMENAINYLEKSKTVFGKELSLLYYLGFAYSRIGDNNKSVELFNSALAQEPTPELKVDILAQMGLIYEGMKQYNKSDSLYELGLKIDPENHLILNNYGYSLSERGLQLERCETMSKKALDKEPENSSYLDTYGWILYKMGKYENAEKYIKKAVDLRDATGGNGAVINDHLGDIYFKMGKKENAVFYWKRAVEMKPDSPEIIEKIKRGGI
jgi:tetratricopeptide (TPR) repeat protein